ncbi:hypothetical protein JVW63_06775 [Flaviflexus sp. JY899]|uniref:Uncharacterized protein n=2 Tax=Flaviflexus equikiangi TaxID=2758573 RepID=A0ABS2TFG9_9ACTO|nr:hypothetical protein [Flaviflexus equikiangi]
MLGAIPFDIGQYYVHSLRIMQKLAYVYGWHDFLEDVDEVDDETLGILAAFFGVMMGVGSAAGMLNSFLKSTVAPAVEKNIAKQALTKTAWYVPMKKVLKIIGINVTKQSFAKSATKVVPVLGGVISGSLTFTMLSRQSNRLMEHLSELPPPLINAENSEGRVDSILSELEEKQRMQTGKGLRSAVSNYAAERRADISDIQAQLGEQVSATRRRVGTGRRTESSDAELKFTSTLATAESMDASTQDNLEGDAASEE